MKTKSLKKVDISETWDIEKAYKALYLAVMEPSRLKLYNRRYDYSDNAKARNIAMMAKIRENKIKETIDAVL